MAPVKVRSGIRVDRGADRPCPIFSCASACCGTIEVHEDGVERLQRHDGRARGEVLADIHLANAQAAGERRLDDFLLDQRLLRRDLGASGFQRRHVAYRSPPG